MIDVENAKRLYERINQFEREGSIPQINDVVEAERLSAEISNELST